MTIPREGIDYDEAQRIVYQGEPYTGTVQEFHNATGELIAEASYVNGIEHGTTRIYYPGGRLKQERSFNMGLWHGPHRYWHENGQLEDEIVFEDGRQLSRRRWAQDGTPLDTQTGIRRGDLQRP